MSDGLGRPMTPSHTSKGGRRFRYYCTRPEHLDEQVAWRVSGFDLEKLVMNALIDLMLDRSRIGAALKGHVEQVRELSATLAKAERMADGARQGTTSQRLELVGMLKPQVKLLEDGVTIRIPTAALFRALDVEAEEGGHIEIVCSAVRVRRGHEIKLIIPDGSKAQAVPAQRDGKLIALLAEAYAARDLIVQRPAQSINQIAKEAGRCRTRLSRLFLLAHLAPTIVTSILEGKQPRELTRKHLLELDLPIAWHDQHRLLGFA